MLAFTLYLLLNAYLKHEVSPCFSSYSPIRVWSCTYSVLVPKAYVGQTIIMHPEERCLRTSSAASIPESEHILMKVVAVVVDPLSLSSTCKMIIIVKDIKSFHRPEFLFGCFHISLSLVGKSADKDKFLWNSCRLPITNSK